MDFAKRAIDHLHYDIDPVIRNRLDNDFYKLLMRRLINEKHAGTRVRFAFTNRSKGIPLARIIPIEVLRAHLDHIQTLRYTDADIHWVGGNTFYGEEGMFPKPYLNALRLSRLPDYELSIDERGQFVFETEGTWADVMDWEDYFLATLNELRIRSLMRGMTRLEIEITYARAKSKFHAKLEALKEHPGIFVSEFGTRRRHSHLWQRWIIEAMIEVLGSQMVGTSNSYFARELGIPAKGTNAHELPMVYAAKAAQDHPGDDEALRQSQYQVLRDWQSIYGDALRVGLPDTFGTTQFLQNAPIEFSWWKGFRPDSKDPYEATDELVAYWLRNGQDPHKKTIVYADGLDVAVPGYEIQGESIIDIHRAVRDRVDDTYGWGTMASNDFVGCVPGRPGLLDPISIVCKVHSVNGHPAVKISDNPAKAKSPSQAELERYLRVFGDQGIGDERLTRV